MFGNTCARWSGYLGFFLPKAHLDQMPCGVVFYKKSGQTFILNHYAEALLGSCPSFEAVKKICAENEKKIVDQVGESLTQTRNAFFSFQVVVQGVHQNITWHVKPLSRSRGFIFIEKTTLPEGMGLGSTSFARIMDLLPTPVVMKDASSKIQYANEAFLDWLGLEKEDVFHKKMTDLSADGIEKSEASGPRTIWLKDCGGYRRQGMLSADIPVDHQGQQACFVVPHASEMNVEGKAYLALLLENMPMPALLLNHQGMIMLVNSAFEHLIRERKILGRSLNDWLEKNMQGRYRDFLKKARRQTKSGEFFLAKLTGKSARYMRLYANYVSTQGWDPMGCFFVLLYDVTDLKKREIQNIESQKLQALGQLASGISHDFNNLLTAMLGFCDLLLQRHSPQDKSFTDIMQIKQNANRAANLIRQLLLFAKQTASVPKLFNLRECLNEMSFLLRRLIGVTVELRIEHDRSIKDIYADQGQIEQIVMNLAINARDAMPRGGTLTFRTGHVMLDKGKTLISSSLGAGSYVTIDVEDTGCGVPAKNLRKIFDPFFSTKESSGGTGLGLSTVSQILKKMKGGVDVVSTMGEGTKFTLYLPRDQVAVEAKKPEAEPSTHGQFFDFWESASILIVEDEDPVRLFVARGLKSKGYEVFEARDGMQGLDIIKHHKEIRLLITDIMMPGMDGPTLANKAYQHNPHLEIIFVSGYPNENVYEQLNFSKSQAHFLPKPFTLDELTKKAHQALMRRKALA